MKTVCGAIAVALAIFGLLATAQAEEPDDESLRAFLLECNGNLDVCHAYLGDLVLSAKKFSNNPEPTCVPAENNKAVDIMLAHLSDLARDPVWAEGPFDSASMLEMLIDAFPCLTY